MKKLLLSTSKTNQQNLFYSPLSDMFDMNDPLIALLNYWSFEIRFQIGKKLSKRFYR